MTGRCVSSRVLADTRNGESQRSIEGKVAGCVARAEHEGFKANRCEAQRDAVGCQRRDLSRTGRRIPGADKIGIGRTIFAIPDIQAVTSAAAHKRRADPNRAAATKRLNDKGASARRCITG